MTTTSARVQARDPAKPPEYYLAYISRMEKTLDLALQSGNPAMFTVAADYCLRMARAAYSAGSPLSECMTYLMRGTEFQFRYFDEGVGSNLSNLRQIDEYLEAFSAAYLVGAAERVIAAFERVKPTSLRIWERALMGALEAVLLGRAIPADEEGFAAAAKMKEFSTLPALFNAVERRDKTAFAESLEAFATKTWGPPADRVAKNSLKQTYPDYSGKWSFFCAAMCRVMGGVPAVSKKALQYIPVELVNDSKE
jgi:hypothetical protein